jgi:FKBP-type peptidyl-prolyl cis-trans isomerase
MYFNRLIALAGFCLFSFALHAAELTTDQQRFSYTVGVQIGKMLLAQEIKDVDADAFMTGLTHSLENTPPQLTDKEMQDAMIAHSEVRKKERAKLGEANLAKGKSYRDENAKKEGVTTLENGIQYEVITPGEGDHPKAEDSVEIHYKGTLIDGTEFDNSYKRGKPTQFPLNGVIPGFRDTLLLMKPGAKWLVTLPPELAYGEEGSRGSIGPNETLIFEIQYIGLAKAQEVKPKANAQEQPKKAKE